MTLRIGIDLGGTKIEVLAIDSAGCEVHRERRPTPRGDYMATVMTVAALVEETEHRLGRRASVGVGIPGTESATTGLIKNANSTWLIGQPLRRDLQAVLQRPVRLANDANCFALSEAADGAASGAAVVFGVILGTGVGGGIVVNGAVLEGANGIAGEWGHNPLPNSEDDRLEDPPACYCGRRGCVEQYLSGPGLVADHERYSLKAGGGHAGPHWTAQQIVEGAERGDKDCLASLERYADRLARALAQVINILDPSVIVLGGGMSNVDFLYEAVRARWGRHVFSDTVTTRLARNRHGDSSGVRGAAWLWPLT